MTSTINKPVRCWNRSSRFLSSTCSSFVSAQTWRCQMNSSRLLSHFAAGHRAQDPFASHCHWGRRETWRGLRMTDHRRDFPSMSEFWNVFEISKTELLTAESITRYLFCNSVIWFDLAAKLLISLIEFLNSWRSRWSACGFTTPPDVVVDSCDWDDCEDVELLAVIWWRRCDEVVLATREDVVVDELFNTWMRRIKKISWNDD